MAARPAGLSPTGGALAAFLAQPHDEYDALPHTLADFLAQPREDDAPVAWGAAVNPPDSDNYLGEFSIAELAAELGNRPEVGGSVAALVLFDGRVARVTP